MSLSIQTTHSTLLATTDSSLQEEAPQQQHNMNNNPEESTLNFLHTIGDQGVVQDARLKNELIDAMTTEQRPHLRVALLDVILRSTNQEVLEALATSSKACRNYHEWIKDALKDDDWVTIGKMLKALDHLPLTTKTLMDYKLGKAVRIIKEKASTQDKEEINAEAVRIMSKWNDQHHKDKGANGEKRKQPPTNATNPNKKTLRLAISSEPPAKKVQAKPDMNFFERLNNKNNGIRKPAVGLRREESFILESPTDSVASSTSSLVSSSQSSSPTSTSTNVAGPSSLSFPSSSSSSNIAVPSLSSTPSGLNDYSSSLSLNSNLNNMKRNGKKVNFNDDSLVKVRYYSKHSWKISENPHELFEEEDDHSQQKQNGHYNMNHVDFPHLKKSQSNNKNTVNMWQPPARLQLSQECKQAGPVDTEEARVQCYRKAMTPPVIYHNEADIPDSPEEPDSQGCSNETGVKIIPLEDLANYDQEPSFEEDTPYYYNGGDHQQRANMAAGPTSVSSVPAPAPSSSVAAVPVSSATTTATTAPSSSVAANTLSSVYPGLDFPQLEALLNGVFGSTSTSAPSTNNNTVPSSSASSLSNLTTYHHQQQHTLPTGPASDMSTQPSNSYHYNSSGGDHYHPPSSSSSHHHSHRGSSYAGRKEKRKQRRNAQHCRFIKTREGCRQGTNCKFSHDL
ncbi:hypothetical protein BDA99DRAFT_518137 [Phascolomyces articulosus]|uniref:C3H1-type domain-containing protein n=1 Tax=Phascolomyces articulosus TaxID=60185 RepID=A0AAD5JV26_9FUNG|nr:hypothetical protein BDA99DRAFT_518137 [Phascolomyces articulosus]